MKIEDKLIAYFKDNFDAEVTINTHLIDEGIIDSMGVISLITFINQEFGIEFDMDDMTVDKLGTIPSITKLILSKKEAI